MPASSMLALVDHCPSPRPVPCSDPESHLDSRLVVHSQSSLYLSPPGGMRVPFGSPTATPLSRRPPLSEISDVSFIFFCQGSFLVPRQLTNLLFSTTHLNSLLLPVSLCLASPEVGSKGSVAARNSMLPISAYSSAPSPLF